VTSQTSSRPQRILLINPISLGPQHQAFDSTCLYALSREIPDCHTAIELTFLARPNHLDAISNFLQAHNASSEFQSKRLGSNRNGRFSSMLCYGAAMWALFKALRSNKADRIVLMVADNTLTPRFLSLFSGLIHRRAIHLDVMWHNNIENMRRTPKKLRRWAKLSNLKGIKIVVLEDFMVELVARTLPVNQVSVWPFPIPTFLPQIQAALSCQQIPAKAYDFLVSGNHVARAANADFFASVQQGLQACRRSNSDPQAESTSAEAPTVALLGQPRSELPAEPPLTCLPRPVAYSDYLTALHRARFVLFPPDSANRQTASGVMLDAISMGIPIVAPNAGAYTGLYPDCAKGRSLLYDPKAGPAEAIAIAVQISSENYQSLVISMKTMAEQRSPEHFAQSFWRTGER
jgi:hypothetical protein